MVFSVLVSLGKRAPNRPSPAPVPVGTFTSLASPDATSETSPSPPADPRLVTVDALGSSFRIPDGYRVASVLNAFDNSQPGPKRYTITRATPEQEEEYVALIGGLQAKQIATEAPEFVPGGTITIAKATNVPDHEEQLAKTKVPVTTEGGLTGTRFRRVEGLNTYDVTYLFLGEEQIAVSMSYASEEPRFDEDAYQGVLDSLKWLEGGV